MTSVNTSTLTTPLIGASHSIKPSVVQDNNKQPPIRVRQENLHMMNTKSFVNPKFHFHALNPELTEFLNRSRTKESSSASTTARSESFRDIDQKFRKYSKTIAVSAVSANGTPLPSRAKICLLIGQYVCLLLNEGDLVVYKVLDQTFHTIKGVQKKEERSQLNLFINDDASIIVLRSSGLDFLWMWSLSKDALNLQQQSSDSQHAQIPISQSKKGILRSNSYDRRQSIQEQDPAGSERNSGQMQDTVLKGSWLRIIMKDLAGPLQHRSSSFQDGFDLKFLSTSMSAASGDYVKVMQVKLFTKQEYFGQTLKPPGEGTQASSDYDESMLLEMISQSMKVNYVSKGGCLFESSTSNNTLKSKTTNIDFIGAEQPRHKTIITKLDNSGSLAFTVLNSPHMLYCQILFTNFDTSLSISVKLFDFISPDDCPTFDNRGKTNLCIDDAAWTNNDAFVIIIFNSCSFAVLPRLGSSLIQIFNPTILNISQKMVDQFQHYKFPRRFNELILPFQIQQKVSQSKQSMINNTKSITMHSGEEAFLISDGHLTFIFRIEFEPELNDLFIKHNMSFFFVRFCISLERLAVDQDILEKIPQLLTNKLPLFEFEKNAELDEEEDPGQVILTASQINPFEHGQKRMETNQSFNAEFTLDCQVVLLNLKHLLMALRWNKTSPINYYQWLVTVVNDCFFYFLKNSEPVYAFHALRMAEAYCKKYLFPTETDQDMSSFETMTQEFHSQRTDFTDFGQLKKFFEAVHNMYDYHNTKEYMIKSTAEKLQIKYDFFTRLPTRIQKGSGNWRFQFTKNYALLVYYSLIQFRNYQAANFNILFLVFACYILQRYLDTMFLHHLKRIIEVVFRNFQMKKKSDDYELFLGKSGKNFIIGPPEKIKVYQDWVCQVIKFGLEHLNGLYEQENIENVFDICLNELVQNNEKIDKNLGYLAESGKLFSFVHLFNQSSAKEDSLRRFNLAKEFIHELTHKYKADATAQNQLQKKQTEFNLGVSLFLMSELIKRRVIDQAEYSVSIYGMIQTFHKMAIASSAQHCTNFVNQFSLMINKQIKLTGCSCHECDHFGCCSKTIEEGQDMYSNFGITDKAQMRQIIAINYYYLNDITRGLQVLDSSVENQLFRFLLLSTSIKQSLSQISTIHSTEQDLDHQNFFTLDQIEKFQQKANCIQTIRKCLVYIKRIFNDMYQEKKGKKNSDGSAQRMVLIFWAILSIVPQNANPILKEQLLHDSISVMSKVLKYLKSTQMMMGGSSENLVFKKVQDNSDFRDSFPVAHHLLQCLLGSDSIHFFVELFGPECQSPLRDLFSEHLEYALLCVLNHDTGKCNFSQVQKQVTELTQNLLNNNEAIIFSDEVPYFSGLPDKSKQLSSQIVESFGKLAKILLFIRKYVAAKKQESVIIQSINMKVIGKPALVERVNQMKYMEMLLDLSHFDKYQHQQLLISKGLNYAKALLCPEYQSELISCFKLISYCNINRGNKQKISFILDLAKQNKDKFPDLISTLENILFSQQTEEANRYHEERLFEWKLEFISLINEGGFNAKILKKPGDALVKQVKTAFFERCIQVQKIFNVSFNHSFYFDKATFARRYGNILGVNDQMLAKYQANLMKRKDAKEKRAAAPASEEEQHSFRGERKLKQASEEASEPEQLPKIELESLEESQERKNQDALMQGVGESVLQHQELKQIPAVEIAKNLMRNRQLGNPKTPKGSLAEQEAKFTMAKLFAEGSKKFKIISRDKLGRIDESPSASRQRNESIEFDNREFAVARIMKVTRRKNSVRRNLGTPLGQSANEESKQGTQKQPHAKGHRKGMMSVNPSGPKANQAGNFNLRNQKLIEGSIPANDPPTKAGPPPGLPRAGQQSKRANQQHQKPSKTLNKEQRLMKLVKVLETTLTSQAFIIWQSLCRKQTATMSSGSVTSSTPSLKENLPAQIIKKGVFNLLLVKKEGACFTVQELKDILKKKQDNQQTPQLQAIKEDVSVTQPSQQRLSLGGRPFEFIRVQNPNPPATISESAAAVGEEAKGDAKATSSLVESAKQKSASVQGSSDQRSSTQSKVPASQPHHKQTTQKPSKVSSKEQYLNFLQKYKQISEKIEKVQKEMNQLSSDFQKLN